MRKNRKFAYVLLLMSTMVITGCTDWWFASRGKVTQRGKSVYDHWTIATCDVLGEQAWCFKLNALIEAKTKEDTLGVIDRYFAGLSVKLLDPNVYGVYEGTSDKFVALVRTNGKSFETVGAQWEQVTNISTDYAYKPQASQMQRLSPLMPVPHCVKPIVWDNNVLLTSECVADNKWKISAQLGADADLGYFDWMLERVELEILDMPVAYEYHLMGSGRYAFYGVNLGWYGYDVSDSDMLDLHAYVDYTIDEGMIIAGNMPNCEAGAMTLKVSDTDTDATFDVGADVLNEHELKITYAGVTETWDNKCTIDYYPFVENKKTMYW